MNKLYILILTLFSFYLGKSQQTDFSYQLNTFSIEKKGVTNPRTIDEDWNINVQNLEMPIPGSKNSRGQLLLTKEYLKNKYPRTVEFEATPSQRANDPVLGSMFEGNLMSGSVPNDNDIAISDEGFIVSVINSNIFMYDSEADTLMRIVSLGAFTLPLNITNSKFDPKVVYDPMAKKFVLVFLNGSTFGTSKVVICFSTSSNPMDPWNLYALSGNPLNNSTWSDYPVIGISNQDLFIGINTFTNGSVNNTGFIESCFWQVGLGEGYAGGTLLTAYYSNILGLANDTLFNITPIPMGAENTNLDMYLLSNKNVSAISDSLYILKVSGPLSMGTPTLTVTLIRSDREYVLPVDAEQPNGHFFDTGDARIFGGFRVGDQIQYVHTTLDTTTGLTAIYHGFIDDIDGSPVLTANKIVDLNHYLGYPNIAWAGTMAGEAKALITFSYSSALDPGGFAVIHFENDSTYSNIINLKSGNSYVNVIAGTGERWGDYGGIQRKYNDPCKVWAAGHFGKSVSTNGTWIAEISTDPTCPVNPVASINENEFNNQSQLYPNPSTSLFTFQFNNQQEQILIFELIDMNGRVIDVLLDDRIKKGENRFQFSTEYLTQGIYFLRVRSDSYVLLTEKVIKL